MSIEISCETEALLNEEARRQGLSLDALLERLIKERAGSVQAARDAVALPVWHLGNIATLHRRDIYDDAG